MSRKNLLRMSMASNEEINKLDKEESLFTGKIDPDCDTLKLMFIGKR